MKEIEYIILIKKKQTNSDVLLRLRIKNKQTNKKIQFLDPSRQLFYADPKPCLTTPDFKVSVIWGFHKKKVLQTHEKACFSEAIKKSKTRGEKWSIYIYHDMERQVLLQTVTIWYFICSG